MVCRLASPCGRGLMKITTKSQLRQWDFRDMLQEDETLKICAQQAKQRAFEEEETETKHVDGICSHMQLFLLARSLQASRRYCIDIESGRRFRIYLLKNWTDLDKIWHIMGNVNSDVKPRSVERAEKNSRTIFLARKCCSSRNGRRFLGFSIVCQRLKTAFVPTRLVT